VEKKAAEVEAVRRAKAEPEFEAAK
jgi:hypothetical protein